jgi:hypothetical protein
LRTFSTPSAPRARTNSKRTPELVYAILADIASGLNIKQACKANGITDRTLLSWRDEDPDLEERFEAARESMRKSMLEAIKAHAPTDWRAAAEHLRLSFAEYRTGNGPSVQVNTNVGVVVDSEKRKELQERMVRLQSRSRTLSDQRVMLRRLPHRMR